MPSGPDSSDFLSPAAYRDLDRRRRTERKRLIAKGCTPGTQRLSMLVERNVRRRGRRRA